MKDREVEQTEMGSSPHGVHNISKGSKTGPVRSFNHIGHTCTAAVLGPLVR